HDDWNEGVRRFGRGADLLRQFESGNPVHDPVDENKIARVGLENLPGFLAAAGLVDGLSAERLEDRRQERPHVLVVVYDEHTQAVELIRTHASRYPPSAPRA